MIEAKVILDSVAENGARLTTFELTYPRFIHAELMTHRSFSRNAASSRAIPVKKKIERIRASMAEPSAWGVNKPGMQASEILGKEEEAWAKEVWRGTGNFVVDRAAMLERGNCHKQVVNRMMEPWDHITVVVSATKMRNHFKLRMEVDGAGNPMADPTYYELAAKWKDAYDASVPKALKVGQWHLPYVGLGDAEACLAYDPRQEPLALMRKISVGRCARVSYLRQGMGDVEENVRLHDRLAASGHWSPFEHVCTPISGIVIGPMTGNCDWCSETFSGMSANVRGSHVCGKCSYGHIHSGNFHGWTQYRKTFEGEAGGD